MLLNVMLDDFEEEIVEHPLMDAFIEWDADRTDYHDHEALALMWHEFLRWRPDITPEHEIYCRIAGQPPIQLY